MSDTPLADALNDHYRFSHLDWYNLCGELERENAALRKTKDAYFRHNNVLVELMTEEQKKKALEILVSRRKEAQP